MGPARTVSVPAGGLGPVPAAHPGPPVFLQVDVLEGEVLLRVAGEQKTLLPWLGLEGPFTRELTADQSAALMERGRALFEDRILLDLDGVETRGNLLEALAFDEFGPGNPEPSLQFDLRYPCTGTPRKVDLEWPFFAEATPEDEDNDKVPLLVKADGEFDFVTLNEEEPAYTWHTRAHGTGREDIQVEPLIETAEAVELPLPSVFVLAAALPLATLLSRRGGLPRALGVLVSCGVVAALLWNTGRVEAPWSPRVTLPVAAQAREMFETLHRNIYRAFEAKTEDQIYDVLAASVDAELLDELYGEIYESLILRGEGGAVCQIEEVEVLDGEVLLPEEGEAAPDELAFDVDWKWQVRGLVTHYGHQHQRTNQYRARYTVGHDGRSWRITGVETLEHQRSEDGGELRDVELPGRPDEEDEWEDDWDEDEEEASDEG